MAPGMNSEVITSCRADGPLIWRVQVLHGWDMVAFVGQVGNLMSRAYGTPPLRSRATAPGMNSGFVTGCRAVGPLKRLCRCCIGGACRTYATGVCATLRRGQPGLRAGLPDGWPKVPPIAHVPHSKQTAAPCTTAQVSDTTKLPCAPGRGNKNNYHRVDDPIAGSTRLYCPAKNRVPALLFLIIPERCSIFRYCLYTGYEPNKG